MYVFQNRKDGIRAPRKTNDGLGWRVWFLQILDNTLEIETDGSVFSGPDSAYRSFCYFKKNSPNWHNWYSEKKWFTSISDETYNFIAKHRSVMFTLTKLFVGKNPEALKPYSFLLLLFLLSTFYLLLKYL